MIEVSAEKKIDELSLQRKKKVLPASIEELKSLHKSMEARESIEANKYDNRCKLNTMKRT